MADFTFSTRLRGRDVYIFHGPEWMEAEGDVNVIWALEIDAREYGIKSFDVTVQKVEMFLHLTDEQEQEHEQVISTPSAAPEPPPEGDVRAELLHYGRPEDFKIKVVFDHASESHDYLPSLVPHHAEIDLARRTIEISF